MDGLCLRVVDGSQHSACGPNNHFRQASGRTGCKVWFAQAEPPVIERPERRLLVVDDEPDFASFVELAADRIGYRTQVTHSALEAQGVYADYAPHIFVLDMVMPQSEGIELLVWLAEQSLSCDDVVVTGFNPHHAEAAAKLADRKGVRIAAVLAKPVRLNRLDEVLRALDDAARSGTPCA